MCKQGIQNKSLYSMLLILLSICIAGVHSQSRIQSRIVKCPNIACPSSTICPDPNFFYFYFEHADKSFNVTRKLNSGMTAALLLPNYHDTFLDVTSGSRLSYCRNDSTPIGGDINVPVFSCSGDSNSFYFFTNYIGTRTLPARDMYPYNGLSMEKYLLFSKTGTDNPHDDILNSWGFFKNGPVPSSFSCKVASIPDGYPNATSQKPGDIIPTITSKRIAKFPQGRVLYCKDKNLFYKVVDSSNTIENYISRFLNFGVVKSFDEMSKIASNPGCAYNQATGQRIDASCQLSSDIQYIERCATHFPATCSTPSRSGYYTCGNDIVKRVWYYDSVARSFVYKFPSTTELFSTIELADCTCLPGYSLCTDTPKVNGQSYKCRNDNKIYQYSLNDNSLRRSSARTSSLVINDCSCYNGDWTAYMKFINGEYYGCENNPTQLVQYQTDSGSIRTIPVPTDPYYTAGWNQLLSSVPKVTDCSLNPNGPTSFGAASYAFQGLKYPTLYPLSLISPSDNTCLTYCQNAILRSENYCHVSVDVKNPDFMNSTSTTNLFPKSSCLSELLYRCVAFDFPSVACYSWFNILVNNPSSPFRTIYQRCAYWANSGVIDLVQCNRALSDFQQARSCPNSLGRNTNCDNALLLRDSLATVYNTLIEAHAE